MVEAVERYIQEGLEPKEATLRAMKEITGPVIGVALVLASVFVPTAFIPGITGRLYQQFAVTIAVSVMISAFNALTLSPALCALAFAPTRGTQGARRESSSPGSITLFGRATEWICSHRRPVHSSQRHRIDSSWLLLPPEPSFWPKEFRPVFCRMKTRVFSTSMCNCRMPLPCSAPTWSARKLNRFFSQTPGVQYVTATVGSSLLSGVQSTYSGFLFVTLAPWEERKGKR